MTTLKTISKFAGESFGTDNFRIVYAGEAQDNRTRPDRTLLLVGPIGAGKSALIDFLCNYFYGVKFESDQRFKIADETFDSTTPRKAVNKYVFNGTDLAYRPIVIDTPGIGDPRGLKADRELAGLVRDYLSSAGQERIHAVGLVLPGFVRRLSPQLESDLEHTLSLFPSWMRPNIVPVVTFADQPQDFEDQVLRHFRLHQNRRFFLDTRDTFAAPHESGRDRERERAAWLRNEKSVAEFLTFFGGLRPQTLRARLPSEGAEEPQAAWTSRAEEERLLRSTKEERTVYYESSKEVTKVEEDVSGPRTDSKTAEPIGSGARISSDRFPNPLQPLTVRTEARPNMPYVEQIEETVENLELLRRYIYDPHTRTYRMQYAHEVKVHESRRSSQATSLRNSYSDLRSTKFYDVGPKDDASRTYETIKRNNSEPNLDKENRLQYSPDVLKKLLGDSMFHGSATLPPRDQSGSGTRFSSEVRPQVVRRPHDPGLPIQTNPVHVQPLRPRQESVGQAFEPAPVRQLSPDRNLDRSRDGIFERNSSSRQSLHNSPIRHGGVRHAIVTRDPNEQLQPYPDQQQQQQQQTNEVERPVILTQHQRVQAPGQWMPVGGGREIVDTTRTYYPGQGAQAPGGPRPGQWAPGQGQWGPGQGGQPNPVQAQQQQHQQQQQQHGSNPNLNNADPRYSQVKRMPTPGSRPGIDQPPQSFQPKDQPYPGPYVQTTGLRTDYVGRREGRWIERTGYEVTREDLIAPKFSDSQRLLEPGIRPRRKPTKRSTLFNCCFYVVAPIVVVAVVTAVIITLVLIA